MVFPLVKPIDHSSNVLVK